MNETIPAPSPVIQELTTLLQDACPDLEDWEFKICVAQAGRKKKKRCTKQLMHPRSKEAEELWHQFGLMTGCPETSEFLDQVAGFLMNSHCVFHTRNAVDNLEKWKKGHVTTASSLPVQFLTIHDDHDSKATSPMAPKVAATTQTMECAMKTSAGGKSTEVSVSITTATVTASTKAITTDSLSITDNHVNDTTATSEMIIGLGLVDLQQNESKEDTPVLLEMQKPLTPEETDIGVVYVQEHQLANGLFKIGWMAGTARDSIRGSDSCNTLNSRIVYETPSGPFFAASKVKRLAQIALHPHDLRITECQQCGRGHEGWFIAPEEMVLETVKTMEAFVQLPAYESTDGQKWGLSFAADEMIKSMGDFSLEILKDTMNATQKSSTDKTAASVTTQSSQETVTCTAETVASSNSLDSKKDWERTKTTDTPGAIDTGTNKKKPRPSMEKLERMKKNVSRQMGSWAFWDRSPNSTPERE